jgi:prophage regulatory protein
LGKSTIEKLVRRGDFPAPIRLTRHAIGWRVEDIDGWLAARDVVRTTSAPEERPTA